MRDEFHPPVEEYLKTIHTLAEEDQPVIGARIAERLGKSAASVSGMLDRLIGEGYVARSGRALVLTATGAAVAARVVRRQRLAECLLVDVIGVPWHTACAEAGRWEHVISDDVEVRLVELLGDPATCPHGNPIPGGGGPAQVAPPTTPLADVAPGTGVRFCRVSGELELDPVALRFLDDAGFVPGAAATVETRGPDGTVLLALGGRPLALGRHLCQRLFVTTS